MAPPDPMDTASTADVQIICEEIPPGRATSLIPARNQKVVHLVRHGQATHNVQAINRLKEGTRCPCMSSQPDCCPYTSEANRDARLTQRGRLQATTAGPGIVRTGPRPQVAIVSPLYRTLQTAAIALSTIQDLQLPVIVDAAIRERKGLHLCDMRSPREHVENTFRGFDFSAIQYGPDNDFGTEREPDIDLGERGKRFFLSLRDRPEHSFAVFSHSSFLYYALSLGLVCHDPNAARRFVTGEVRTVLLTFE